MQHPQGQSPNASNTKHTMAPGEAELARYASILASHKVENNVLHELLEQRRARRQIGWTNQATKKP